MEGGAGGVYRGGGGTTTGYGTWGQANSGEYSAAASNSSASAQKREINLREWDDSESSAEYRERERGGAKLDGRGRVFLLLLAANSMKHAKSNQFNWRFYLSALPDFSPSSLSDSPVSPPPTLWLSPACSLSFSSFWLFALLLSRALLLLSSTLYSYLYMYICYIVRITQQSCRERERESKSMRLYGE